jgi:hypothetical protein
MNTPWRILHSEASRGWGGQEHRVMAELSGFQKRGWPVWLVAHPQSQVLQRANDGFCHWTRYGWRCGCDVSEFRS